MRGGFLLAAALALMTAGCRTTSSIETGMAHPSLEIVGSGVKFDGNYVSPWEVPDILERHGVKHDTVVHIRLHELDRLKEAQAFRHLLAQHGYRRTALVTKEHTEAWSRERQNADAPAASSQKRPKIRYRSASED